jgi:hypothetical protein
MSAQPANDNLANAIEISNATNDLGTNKIDLTGTLLGSTLETSEPNHASGVSGYNSKNSVWYKWQAPGNGTLGIHISTFAEIHGAGDYIVVAVYTGSAIASLVALTKSVAAGVQVCDVSIAVNVGVIYRIAISGASATNHIPAGIFALRLTYGPTPANDDFADAIDLGVNSNIVTRGTVIGSTLEKYGEPLSGSYWPSRNVWYKWTAPKTGTVTISIPVGDIATGEIMFISLGVSISTVDNVNVLNNDQAGPGGTLSVAQAVIAGYQYYIAVGTGKFGSISPFYFGNDFTMTINIP